MALAAPRTMSRTDLVESLEFVASPLKEVRKRVYHSLTTFYRNLHSCPHDLETPVHYDGVNPPCNDADDHTRWQALGDPTCLQAQPLPPLREPLWRAVVAWMNPQIRMRYPVHVTFKNSHPKSSSDTIQNPANVNTQETRRRSRTKDTTPGQTPRQSR
ncbi:hypothetical protein BKA82DRAFT_4019632 [Pisolithus tinctorius]|nr:hypothetical protein BKA82DRAFT_4019632 [Pisolithus tinctorius]